MTTYNEQQAQAYTCGLTHGNRDKLDGLNREDHLASDYYWEGYFRQGYAHAQGRKYRVREQVIRRGCEDERVIGTH